MTESNEPISSEDLTSLEHQFSRIKDSIGLNGASTGDLILDLIQKLNNLIPSQTERPVEEKDQTFQLATPHTAESPLDLDKKITQLNDKINTVGSIEDRISNFDRRETELSELLEVIKNASLGITTIKDVSNVQVETTNSIKQETDHLVQLVKSFLESVESKITVLDERTGQFDDKYQKLVDKERELRLARANQDSESRKRLNDLLERERNLVIRQNELNQKAKTLEELETELEVKKRYLFEKEQQIIELENGVTDLQRKLNTKLGIVIDEADLKSHPKVDEIRSEIDPVGNPGLPKSRIHMNPTPQSNIETSKGNETSDQKLNQSDSSQYDYS